MTKRPIVLVVMDGVGLSPTTRGNAVNNAYTPYLDKVMQEYPNIQIKAHGVAVGLPSDEDMGNSEVGHNALGCGQIYSQGAKLVNESIASGFIYTSETWKNLVANVKDQGTMHFIGLLSDGNVHSHIEHLFSLIREAKKEGVPKVRIHILLDGRDVPETSGLIYVDQLEAILKELNSDTFDAKIASGGGRMKITMDRYEANWSMVDAGWKTHVLGEGRFFRSAHEAIETFRSEAKVSDQDLPAFVIAEDNQPVGTIQDGDSVVLFNFRGDRALELSRAFEEVNFTKFDRKRFPKVMYAGMLQYDGDLKIPTLYLVNPPKIKNTMTEYFMTQGIKQFAVSETQKFGHVTYFWNGNRSEKFDDTLETWVEIKSDIIPFEQRPWMKAAEITDQLINAMESQEYQFLRANFPNGDMVGHTGNYQATIIGVETVDLQIGRILEAAKKTDAIVIITADHGNADEMYEKSKDPADIKPKTAHTLNPVPFIIIDQNVSFKEGAYGLANVASTVSDLLGIKSLPMWEESMIVQNKY